MNKTGIIKTIVSKYVDPAGVKLQSMPFDEDARVLLIPHDKFIDNEQTGEFMFELVYEDMPAMIWYYEHYPCQWVKAFDASRRSLLADSGCTCHPIYLSSRCKACATIEYDESKATQPFNNNRSHKEIVMRTYYWAQIGTERSIDWCFYEIDYAKYTDNNYGLTLLNLLNDGLDELKMGRRITNAKDNRNIVPGCMLLRREAGTDGSIPPDNGNVLIDGVEHLHRSVFGSR